MKPFQFAPRILRDLRGYNRRKFTADLIAGIVVGIVALPLAIAFAIAASPGGDVQHTIGPVAGILTAIVAGVIISALGGSRVQIGGPTGAFIVIIYGVVAQFGLSGLLIATIMAGLFLVLLGVFRLGAIIKFIPYPIVVGFTSGIALTIFTTQVKDLFGLQIEGGVPAEFIDKWLCYFRHFQTFDPASTLDLKDNPDLIKQYRYYHSRQGIWPEILQGIKDSGILEMEIFLLGTRLVMIVELAADAEWDEVMQRMGNVPRQAEWEDFVAQFQKAAAGAASQEKWQPMERIFHVYEE